MTRWLTSSWVVALMGGLLYLGTTAALMRPAQFAGAHAKLKAQPLSPGDDPSWRFHNPEFDQWVAELKSEKAKLAERQQQLDELQTRLQSEQAEFSAATQTVYQLQSQFDENVVRIKQSEMQNLQRQAKLISAMSPQGVASLVGQMSDDDIVRLLTVMKPDSASQILDALSQQGTAGAKRAALLTERLQMVLPPGPGKSTP
jgi:flagellar motility protein MotE (MotC chaperone)